MDPEALGKAVTDLMASVSTMTLATCRDNTPRATDVYFANVNFDAVFFSSPDSEHSQNLRLNGNCSATIHPVVSGWKDIRGLRLDGVAVPVEDPAFRDRAVAAYLAKFPFAAQFLAAPTGSENAARSIALYVLRAAELTYIDNSLGFGTKIAAQVDQGLIAGLPGAV